jgi:hypothetical protein
MRVALLAIAVALPLLMAGHAAAGHGGDHGAEVFHGGCNPSGFPGAGVIQANGVFVQTHAPGHFPLAGPASGQCHAELPPGTPAPTQATVIDGATFHTVITPSGEIVTLTHSNPSVRP